MLRAILVSFLFVCCSSEVEKPLNEPVQKNPPVEGVRIAWDFSTLKMLSREDANYAGYARMIPLHDKSLICVYETDGNIECIRSHGNLQIWSEPIVIAKRENQITRCVPEILEKEDHSLLVSYNLRPEGINTDTSKRFSIRVKHSTDGGRSWNNEIEVYRAGHEFKNGCWEPAQVQLPSGEIQLFIANEGPYTQSDEQEITVLSSFNGGYKWTDGKTACFRKGLRDGMPVPLVLKNSDEIIFSIEDNGIAAPQFKPVIIRSSIDGNWNTTVSGYDPDRRTSAMDQFNIIPNEKYAGAPYIRRLNSGEIILSYQSDENRIKNKWDLSDMIVCIGDSTGRNYNRKSLPFFTDDQTKTCLWNSLAVINDSTVVALASTNNYGNKTGVWMISGRILKNIKSPKQSMVIDGEIRDPVYSYPSQAFIGGYGPSNAQIRTCWDEKMFFASVVVTDHSIQTSAGDAVKNDGIQILLDPANKSTNLPDQGIFAIHVSANGKLMLYQGDNGQWKSMKGNDISSRVKLFTNGYIVEVGIPWKLLGVLPPLSRRIGFNVVLNEVSGQGNYSEPISGNVKEKPFTWSSLYLQK